MPSRLTEKQQTPGIENPLEAGKNPKFVTSPGYPKKYFSNSKFSWIITAPKYSIITLEVNVHVCQECGG